MTCFGCGQSGHEAWQCGSHLTFDTWRVHFSGDDVNIKYTIKSTKALHLMLDEPYIPVRSPHNLIQECVYSDPWKVLVCCLCLNCTSGAQTRQVIFRFFEKYPTPHSFLAAPLNDITELLKPLGLWKKRPLALQQMSKDYLESDWTTPTEIFGVGKYGNDAYLIFCCGKWQDVQPSDHMLNHYVQFMYSSHGLERKFPLPPIPPRKRPGNKGKIESKFFKKVKLTDEEASNNKQLSEEKSPFFSPQPVNKTASNNIQ